MLFIGAAVKQVADNDKLTGFEKLNLGEQALHIFPEYGLRNSNTAFTKVAAFAKMKIGKDQSFFFFPKNTAFMAQPKCLLLKIEFYRRRQIVDLVCKVNGCNFLFC